MKNYKYFCSILVFFLFVLQFSTNSQNIYPFVYWNKVYNAPSNLQDSSVAIVSNSLGQVFVAGWSLTTAANADLVVLRYNPDNGDTIWSKRYVGTGQNRISSMACDNNAVYVTGYFFTGGTNRDIITIKYSASDGTMLWAKTHNGPGSGGDYGFAIAIDAGFVYVTGRTDNVGSQKIVVLKYDIANGNLASGFPFIYTGSLSTIADEGLSIKVDGSGGIYVTGIANFSPPPGDILTIKLNSGGTVAWVKRHNGLTAGSDEGGVSLVLDNAGTNVYVTGFSTRVSNQDYVTFKYGAATGDSLAFATYNNIATDIPVAMTIDGSGYIYVTGFSINAQNRFDIATIRYNANLQQQWVKRTVSLAGYDLPSNIIIGTNNDVYVVGATRVGVNADYLTIRYNASTGDTIWTKTENGTANSNDFGVGVAVLDSSKVFVTGSAIFSPATTSSFYTLRYANQIVGIRPISTEIPVTYKVHQNYPNPFNPVTSIRFDIPKKSIVEVIVYDVMGRVVELLGKENLDAGKYEVKWDAAKYSSGLYFYKVQAGGFSQVKKMILVK